MHLWRYFSPEQALVFVGIATCGLIAWQSWETRRSASAMLKSIKLQQTQMRQWVELADWRGGAEFAKAQKNDDELFLLFEFDILNPTDHAMTLVSFQWRSGEHHDGFDINAALPPKKPHPTVIRYDLSAEEMMTYMDMDPLELKVEGNVGFIDVLGNRETQPFEISFHCRKQIGIIVTKSFKTAAWSIGKDAKDMGRI